MRWVLIAGLLAAGGCAFANEPWIGSGNDLQQKFVCVANASDTTGIAVAQARFEQGQLGNTRAGAVTRTIEKGRPRAGRRACFRWPWISEVGRAGLVVRADTTWGPWFNPWARR